MDVDQTVRDLSEAFLEMIQFAPIPIRRPSFNKPSFWSRALNITRARPVEDDPLWQDFLVVKAEDLHPRVIKRFVVTSQNEGAVSWRFARNNTLPDQDSFNINTVVEKNLDRFAANPYPCNWRDVYIRLEDDDIFRIQVLNTSGQKQLCFAGVQGWYYPQLRSPSEISRSEGMTDQVRNF